MFKRFRHKRINQEVRIQNRETLLQPEDFVLPLFIIEENDCMAEIPSMPGVYHLGINRITEYLKPLVDKGLKEVLLFPVPEKKGIDQAWDATSYFHQSISLLRASLPQLKIMCDVCLCAFTEDGHCHIGDNDATLPILAKIARSYAVAGAHVVAPSDMMDGRIQEIHKALADTGTEILSYSAKYASAFYGPFRDATDCAPKNGSRKEYQMDPGNRREAIEETQADIEEGADHVMVKPALSYLDIISDIRSASKLPLYAYNVSGEYIMLKNAVDSGIASESIIYESLLSIKRAGADKIISYFTPYIIEKFASEKSLEVNCL